MVDNFKQLSKLLTFDGEDDFYYVQVLKRKKENKELGSNSHIVKTYYIKSAEELFRDMPEMICLADFHNARVCINLNKRSFEKTCYHTLKKITDQILNKSFKEARKAYNSVCGLYSEGDKTWVVDIDGTGRDYNEMLLLIDSLQPEGGKLVTIVQTKNGLHLITKPFNLQDFRAVYPDIDVHKNNPTVLYIP
jgi:hypothetical protein